MLNSDKVLQVMLAMGLFILPQYLTWLNAVLLGATGVNIKVNFDRKRRISETGPKTLASRGDKKGLSHWNIKNIDLVLS